MDIQITARHSKASESLKETIQAEVARFEKYDDRITTCHVIIDEEGPQKKIEIVVHTKKHQFAAHGLSESLGVALDEAVNHIETQLRKNSEKLKNHKGATHIGEAAVSAEHNTNDDQ
jgi:ribosomal subunit interface protein